MSRSVVTRKEKKTFSLSQEAVRYLEKVRREEHKSASEILEQLIEEKKLAVEQQRISHNIRNYYDSLTADEQAEDRLWGELSESQFPGE